MSDAYREAGVDIQRGQELVQQIQRSIPKHSSHVLGGIGGFASMVALPSGYREPVLVSSTDGVGTKILLASTTEHYRVLGWDLVAMCINDIAVMGAKSMYFLDYMAASSLEAPKLLHCIEGMAQACTFAGCDLVGGESAEMPGVYPNDTFDMAGFVTGIVEKSAIVSGQNIQEGDRIIGFASNGVHANGFSLIRHILKAQHLNLDECYTLDMSLLDSLMQPTVIYEALCQSLTQQFEIHGLAHITGGGIPDNLKRILPVTLSALLHKDAWQWPPIFQFLQHQGEISWKDMISTFNCGIGLIAVVAAKDVDVILQSHSGIDLGVVQQKDKVSILWR